ncbi:ABC transporter ATP-binding protein [Volucribacter amazonae]|uniref:ABC transporter ATP-binding protein n=1 Tax=Volucribacter amazonae TaxID=256731 RepID=A0A9X4SJU1_9PAST|nr:ABC transporter ATP-binding protein [Volucribacter amazonae]MDG6894479.1 ABC transporter ATP-binding protein [Volucribacter amazonae]
MIDISQLSYRYPDSQDFALQQINLHIPQGKTIGLLGSNGAGKTTLMSLLAGLLPIQQGQIYLENIAFADLTKLQRQKISLVPQDFAFYPLLTVWENLKFFAALYSVKNAHYLSSLLEMTGLTPQRDKLAKQLSGGMKRRLNFIIGLINQPKIIFLDEITVGVDPLSRQFILSMVKQLHEQGITIIYTSHYLQEIEQLCQEIVLLQQGTMVYQGDMAQILAQNDCHSLEQFYLNFLAKQADNHVN